MRIPTFDPQYGKGLQPDYSNMYPYQFDVPPMSPVPPMAPQDPYNLAQLAQEEDAKRQAYYDAMMQTVQDPVAQPPMPGLSKQQGWIAGGLGLLSALSGPQGNAPGIAGNFVQQTMKRNTDQWQQALDAQKEQRAAELKRKELKAKMAQLDYEDKAREHGQAVNFKHQEDYQQKQDALTYKRQTDLENLKLQGDPQYQIAQLNAKLMNGEITKEQWQMQVIPLIKNDPWAKAAYDQARAEYTKGPLSAKATADAALTDAKKTDLEKTRDARIAKIQSATGVDKERAALYHVETQMFPEKTAVQMAKDRAYTEKALRPPMSGEKAPTIASQRAAINSERSRLRAQLIEQQKLQSKGSGFGIGIGPAIVQERIRVLTARLNELDSKLEELNGIQYAPGGKNLGFMPRLPDGTELSPTSLPSTPKGKIGASTPQLTAADALDQLGL